MTRRPHCPWCEDFGRVETEFGLLACPEPRHRSERSLSPCDGPTAGEQVEERYRLREAAEGSRRTRDRWNGAADDPASAGCGYCGRALGPADRSARRKPETTSQSATML
jgi:hypothetical protein